MLMGADNPVFVFSSPRRLIEINVQCVYPKEHIYIYLFIPPPQPSLSHERQSAGEEPSPSSLCHPSNVYFFF